MRYNYNELFIKKLGKEIMIEDIKLTCNLYPNILDGDILEISGWYYLSSIYDGVDAIAYDKTGTENLNSKILIEDYIKKSDKRNTFMCAIGYANALAQKLDSLFTDNFKVVLSFNKKYHYISFYKIREDEPYLTENLDDYKFEGMLTIDTGNVPD